jgi:hypothetical protein
MSKILQTEGVGAVRFQNHHTYDDDSRLSSDAGSSDDEGELTDSQEYNLPDSKPILVARCTNPRQTTCS